MAKKESYLNGMLEGGNKKSNAKVLPDGYRHTAKELAEKQLTLAGYRLAALLDSEMRP